jgi:hypothetical protein
MIPEGRLLCQVIKEQLELARWENEGGALAPPPADTPELPAESTELRVVRRNSS